MSDLQLFTRRVDADNLDAAKTYLSLLWSLHRAAQEIAEIEKHAQVFDRRANDIVRSAGGVPWGWDDPGVHRELLKVLSGKKLHPPILVNQETGLVIADGSHRVSFAYHVDPFMTIPVFMIA